MQNGKCKIAKNLLPSKIEKEISAIVKKCYACGKCTSGCPVAQAMDFQPSLLVKRLSLGDIEEAIKSKMIWVCSGCQTCYTRCPFEINIPNIIDILKEYANKDKLNRKERATQLFHKIFLFNIKYLGRIYETGFISAWKGFSGNWFNDLGLGKKMFFKGKLPLLPEKIKDLEGIKRLFRRGRS